MYPTDFLLFSTSDWDLNISDQSWVSWVLLGSSTSDEVALVSLTCRLWTSCPLVYRKPLPSCLPAPAFPPPGHQEYPGVSAQVSPLLAAQLNQSTASGLMGSQTLWLGSMYTLLITWRYFAGQVPILNKESREVPLEDNFSAVVWSLCSSCSFKTMIACPQRPDLEFVVKAKWVVLNIQVESAALHFIKLNGANEASSVTTDKHNYCNLCFLCDLSRWVGGGET